MTVLKRRTRDSRTEAVEANGGGTALAVAAFEYVQVEDTALVRLTGTWSGDRGHPMDMALVASRSSGEQQSFPAHASAGSRIHLEGALWEVAFSVPTGLAESRLWKFSLRAGSETIELPPPRQHRAPAGAVEPDPPSEEGEVDPDARVRQAEAAISWIERQLTRERDARRAAEQELAKARPELEARRREREHVAALELQAAHLAEERKRRTELEAQLKEVEGRLHELSREHNFNEQLKVEVGELANERDRLLPLHDRVDELTAERDKLAAERDKLAAERDRRSEL